MKRNIKQKYIIIQKFCLPLSYFSSKLLDPSHLFKTLTFPKRQILDSSKLKESADDNLKFDQNDRKFSKPIENTVGKGEIARYEQFHLFPQCF